VELLIAADGNLRLIYDECLDLTSLGAVSIERASWVEPDSTGRWMADLAPVGGPRLGPFAKRSEALEAELAWLKAYWIV
jgi:hypothetical protein